MSLAQRVLSGLNRVIPKRERAGRGTGTHSYSEAQYGWAEGDVALFEGGLDLAGKNVLDAGCGPGGKTIFHAERGVARITGVDRSPDNIAQAKRFAELRGVKNAEFVAGSLDALPFPSGTFDAALMSDVVEHIDRSILDACFTEVGRVLKPGGMIALYFPPWTSFDASHLYDRIHLPWCQLLFSDETLFRVLRETSSRGNEQQIEGAIQHYRELNRITIREFQALVRRLGFRVESMQLKTIKNLPRSGALVIDQFLTKRVVACISTPQA